jgi:predicted phosphodiesterase
MDQTIRTSLLKALDKQNVSDEEAQSIIKQLRTPRPKSRGVTVRNYGGKHFKIGVASDLHVGHKCFRPDIFEDSVRVFKKEGVEEIYIPGDIIEGMSNRDGHIYELNRIGVSAQVNYAADLLNQYAQPKTVITANHDGWAMKKSNQGVDVGQMLEDRVSDLHVAGDLKADIKVGNVVIRMTHEGQTAYALSYSLQKRINALSGGDKPGIIINGHLHKALYMFYRNIHAIEAGCLESQTEFMAMKGTAAMMGYWILDIKHSKDGVESFNPTFYPYYD